MKTIAVIISVMISLLMGQSVDEFILQGKEKIRTGINHWNEQELLQARAHFERGLSLNEKQWLFHYYVAWCDHQLANLSMGQQDKGKTKGYVNDGISQLDDAIELSPDFAEAYGLLSSLYGTKIGLIPWTGFWYGPKAGRSIGKALSLEPDNPRLHMIQGISTYFTPEQWGGGKEKAKVSFQKAIELYKNDNPEPILPDWGKSDVHAWLGQVELSLGDSAQAIIQYERALEIDPDNNWINTQLMPKVKGK
ncbi:MAG: tetratricopeptide repeat protein [Candidatus Marinimicrobia bacterium]|nr:tetratricopeptide repeat protein [Candidatus Neomarinimicrobiota bacterium]